MSEVLAEVLTTMEAEVERIGQAVDKLPRQVNEAARQGASHAINSTGIAEAASTLRQSLQETAGLVHQLHAVGASRRRAWMVAAVLALVLAAWGGLEVGRLVSRGVLDLSTPAACASAGGNWQSVQGRGVCSFWAPE